MNVSLLPIASMDFSKIKNYLFIGLLLVVSILFLFLLKPFAYSIFWAAVIAALFYGPYVRIRARVKNPNLATAITMALVLLILIIPGFIVIKLVADESFRLYRHIIENWSSIQATIVGTFNSLRENTWIARAFDAYNIDGARLAERIPELAGVSLSWLSSKAVEITRFSLEFAIMFIIMLYSLFYFIREGEAMLKKLMHISPLGDKYEKLLYSKFTSTARATLKGNLIVAMIQGTLGGILFALVGIPGALIWGIFMILFSFIPGLGSFIVWLPAALVMFITGNIWQAIVIVLVGALVIGTIDNFLRPILVGKDLRMHPLIIFFSTLGGIFAFGPSGFVIGPIIAALFFSFWEMYEHYYHNELSNDS